MGKLGVRQAIEYGVNKAALQTVYGGPAAAQILNTAITPGNAGYQNYSLYQSPGGHGDTARCKTDLVSAGFPNGLTLTYMYASDSVNSSAFRAIQTSLKPCGVNLVGKPEPPSASFTNLANAPANNKAGTWDMGQPVWAPDFYGNNGRSVLAELFMASCVFGTTNYGCYHNTALDSMITQAEAAPDIRAAGKLWHQADLNVMQHAVIVPLLTQQSAIFSSSRVHQADTTAVVFAPNIGGPDITNVWLKNA